MVAFNDENGMKRDGDVMEAIVIFAQELISNEERTGKLDKAFQRSGASNFASFIIGACYGVGLVLVRTGGDKNG
ncbi:MAG: hypothetical protein JRJ62_16270 [Deltaproteobacteria bacterium]|nr:hypothetical protein [Deltaproteobacteria bacterium]